MQNAPPILVTGAHRSGTTWMGKMLSIPSRIAYIHEPFNKVYTSTGYGIQPHYWFQYIDERNEHLYYPKMLSTLNFKLICPARAKFRSIDDVKIYIKRNLEFLNYQFKDKRPLLKDPIALFSTPWLNQHFNCQPVILIRHPAAFVYSLKKQNWHFDFNELYYQHNLMNDCLPHYKDIVKSFANNQYSLLDQAILLWKISHDRILSFQKQYENWIYIKHDEIAKAPLRGFQSLYQQLQIPFTEKVKQTIENYSQSQNNESKATNAVNHIQRDSESTTEEWKSGLASSEITYLFKEVEYLADKFYPEDF